MARAASRLFRLFSPVYLLFSRSFGEAFTPAQYLGNEHTSLLVRGMSASMKQTGSTTNNWRIIPTISDDHAAKLIGRPTWSETQYKESLELYHQLMSCSDSYVHPGIKIALNTLDHAYRLYGPNSVICSFNGEKMPLSFCIW